MLWPFVPVFSGKCDVEVSVSLSNRARPLSLEESWDLS